MSVKKRRVKMTPEEREKVKRDRKLKLEKARIKKIERAYFTSIENIFKFSGFVSLPVENKKFDLRTRPECELDHCFVSENIIVICEETTGKRDSNHLLKKQEMAVAIQSNKEQFLDFLASKCGNQFDKNSYQLSRWKVSKLLYFSKERIEYDRSDETRYTCLKFIDIGTYNYLVNLSKCIKKSFKYEILRFLNIECQDYGQVSAGSGNTISTRDVSIIYPIDVTGLNEGVNIVSFMMSPDELIRASYVLRKDSWEDKIGLYQRLITENRIKSIRKFIIETKRTFFNNIIIGLPDSVKILNEDGQETNISELDRYRHFKLRIEVGFNSLSIIDGQHRIYSYYENDIVDKDEEAVSRLRNRLNLLVTGILFPTDWSDIDKRKFQSEIFLQINRNSKNVDKDILIHIESTKDPFSAQSIARRTLEKMNRSEPFKDLFELSLVEKARIKVASIIQFALSSLVNPSNDVHGLFRFWKPSAFDTKPEKLSTEDELEDYTIFCSNALNKYFSAIKQKYRSSWDDNKSLILRVVAINGFIIAFNHSLRLTDGVEEFDFYKDLFAQSNLDFSKEKFPYAGSRYSQFASEKIEPLFYRKLEAKYLKLIGLNENDVITLNGNERVTARFNGSKFIYGDKECTLFELTRSVHEAVKTETFSENAGLSWSYNEEPLQFIYERNTKNEILHIE